MHSPSASSLVDVFSRSRARCNHVKQTMACCTNHVCFALEERCSSCLLLQEVGGDGGVGGGRELGEVGGGSFRMDAMTGPRKTQFVQRGLGFRVSICCR
jgi:hypothetical protein